MGGGGVRHWPTRSLILRKVGRTQALNARRVPTGQPSLRSPTGPARNFDVPAGFGPGKTDASSKCEPRMLMFDTQRSIALWAIHKQFYPKPTSCMEPFRAPHMLWLRKRPHTQIQNKPSEPPNAHAHKASSTSSAPPAFALALPPPAASCCGGPGNFPKSQPRSQPQTHAQTPTCRHTRTRTRVSAFARVRTHLHARAHVPAATPAPPSSPPARPSRAPARSSSATSAALSSPSSRAP